MRKLILAVMILALTVAPALSANSAVTAPKSYQVTGPVLAIKAGMITVQKGSEKWEIDAGALTLSSGVKVGDKVTIKYTMQGSSLEIKNPKKK